MKRVAIICINFYQSFIYPYIFKQLLGIQITCRYNPTCSGYTKAAIEQHGFLTGIKMGFAQFMHCQPFTQAYESI